MMPTPQVDFSPQTAGEFAFHNARAVEDLTEHCDYMLADGHEPRATVAALLFVACRMFRFYCRAQSAMERGRRLALLFRRSDAAAQRVLREPGAPKRVPKEDNVEEILKLFE